MNLSKFIVACIIVNAVVLQAWAQPSNLGMRDLAVAQMFEYGKSLYERGDRLQAANVFRRILDLDADFTPAQPYAARLGLVKPKPIAAAPKACQKICVVKAQVPMAPVDPNQDLKDDIAQENDIIAQLTAEIAALRGPSSEAKTHE